MPTKSFALPIFLTSLFSFLYSLTENILYLMSNYINNNPNGFLGKCTLTKEVQAQIVEILEAGNYQKTAYESLGIPKSNYFYWLSEGEKAKTKEGKLTKTEEAYLDFLDSIKKAVQVARQAIPKPSRLVYIIAVIRHCIFNDYRHLQY